jgi:hypothetical protein
MEPENFNKAKIDSYYEQVLDYVCLLYKKNTSDVTVDLSKVADTVEEQDKEGINGISELEGKNDDSLVDDHMMSLYQQMKDNDRINNQEKVNDPDKSEREFREKMERMIVDYRQHCVGMDMETWLNEYGNEEYQSVRSKKPKEIESRIIEIKDPGYTSKFFNVLTWWKVEGSIKFKELSVVANIFLGKPTHNGFQERVFSRGIWTES